jgi:peptidoglycan/xylan/chitin deacetylase (PgdA/CDA1 family)
VRAVTERSVARSFAVLNYHRVAEPSCDPWDLAVRPARFDQQIAVLRRRGPIVPLERCAPELVDRLGRDRSRVAVTFDDGYADNLHAAVPLLERHDAPATVFVATDFLGRASFWWDDLAELHLTAGLTASAIAAAAADLGVLDGAEREVWASVPMADLHVAMYERLVWRPLPEIVALVDALAAATGVEHDRSSRRPLTTDELVRLAAHPLVTIGAHTASHPRLAWLTAEQARADIERGNARLDAIVGPAERVLAYPYGNTSRRTVAAARAAGTRVACTTDPRWVSPIDRSLSLPRLHPSDVEGDVFERWLTTG